MNPKIIKLREEHQKNKAKITELSARNRELERRIRELENTDIIGLVRAKGMSLEEFSALMHGTNGSAPIITSESKETEESEHEET